MRPRRRILFPLLAALAASTADAHPMIIQPGSLLWRPDGVLITLPIDVHTVEHEQRCFNRDLTLDSLAAFYARSIIARDESGRPLPLRMDPESGDTETIALSIDGAADRISLAMQPRDEDFACPRQVQLKQRSDDGAWSALVQLTTGGNVEILVRPRLDATQQPDPSMFHAPRIIAEPRADSLRIVITYPAILLRAWTEFADLPADSLDHRWLDAHRPALAAWAISHLALSPSEERTETALCAVEAIDMDGRSLDVDPDRSLNTAMARIRWAITIESGDARLTSARWTGFQPGVQQVNATVKYESGAARRMPLNPTQNELPLTPTQ